MNAWWPAVSPAARRGAPRTVVGSRSTRLHPRAADASGSSARAGAPPCPYCGCRRCSSSAAAPGLVQSTSPVPQRSFSTSFPTPTTSQSSTGSEGYRHHHHGEDDASRFRFRVRHLRPVVGPLVLLSIVTSLAFNYAVIRRSQKEEQKEHTARLALLQNVKDLMALKMEETWKPSESPAEGRKADKKLREQELRLAIRLLKTSLSPSSVGLDPAICAEAEAQVLRQYSSSRDVQHHQSYASETRWSEALFGKPGAMKSSMLGAIEKASSVFHGWRSGSSAGRESNHQNQDEDRGWSEQDWEAAIQRALEPSNDAHGVASTSVSSSENSAITPTAPLSTPVTLPPTSTLQTTRSADQAVHCSSTATAPSLLGPAATSVDQRLRVPLQSHAIANEQAGTPPPQPQPQRRWYV